jgi:hypothetical protein
LEELLGDRDRDVLLEALEYLETYPEPRLKDKVLRLYETQTGSIAGRCALLLGQFKDDRLISAYENKSRGKEVVFDEMSRTLDSIGKLGTDQAKTLLKKILSEITEGNDRFLIPSVIHALVKAKEDFSGLLEEYARLYQKWGMEFLYPFTSVCGSWHSLEDLNEEGKKKLWGKGLAPAVLKSLNYLENKGFPSLAENLKRDFSRKDYRQVIETAWQWAEKSI